MKRILFIVLSFTVLVSISSNASSERMTIDTKDIDFSNSAKTKDVVSNFNESFSINSGKTDLSSDDDFNNNIKSITKRTTYLLLGETNSDSVDYVEYTQRRNDLYALRYAPKIPTDENSLSGFDEKSQEYKDDIASGMNIPGMFKRLSEMSIKYQGYGTIKISKTDNYVISRTALSGVTLEEPDYDNPKKLNSVKTNIVLTYFFKQLDDEYKLYWIIAETKDDVQEYFDNISESEDDGDNLSLNSKYISSASDFYDYSKLYSLDENVVNGIYENNLSSIVLLNSYYDKSIVNTGVGFLISDGIIATTWNNIEQSLIKGQFVTIRDSLGNIYDYDGLVTADPDLDIAIIKLKNNTKGKIQLGDPSIMKEGDPVISINTKTGHGLSAVSGVMVSNDNYIDSLIPLSSSDEGSPLFNTSGEVIGMNTARSVNSSVSTATSAKNLSDLQKKISNKNFGDIKTVSFDYLKQNYFYHKQTDESVANNLEKIVWDRYKKIGNIEKAISLKLVKANSYDGIVSLRYQNKVSNFISNMSFAAVFKANLVKEGYRSVNSSESKCVFENDKYKIVILDELGSLIILMAEK